MAVKKGQAIKRTSPQAGMTPRNDKAKAEGKVVRGTPCNIKFNKQ